MTSGIYTITNSINGRVYVGSAVNFPKREKEHRVMLERGCHHSRFLQRAWDKHGASVFVFSLVLHCAKDFLIQWEQIAIDGHKISGLYNICPIAGSRLGSKSSPATRKRISSSNKGRVVSAETRRKIAEANKGNQNCLGKQNTLGYRHTPEARASMSKKRLGRRFSDEWRANMGAARKGIVFSEQRRANISRALKGKILSEETRRRMSEAQRVRRAREGVSRSQK